MKAKEMFENLGYNLNKEYEVYFDDLIIYKKGSPHDEIIFDKGVKTYMKADSNWNPKDITMQELQAINQQCKELGWLE